MVCGAHANTHRQMFMSHVKVTTSLDGELALHSMIWAWSKPINSSGCTLNKLVLFLQRHRVRPVTKPDKLCFLFLSDTLTNTSLRFQKTRLKTQGDDAFRQRLSDFRTPCHSLYVWLNVDSFKQQLKTLLFRQAFI